MGQREKYYFKNYCNNDDANAKVWNITIKEFQGMQHRFGKNSKPAKIKRLLKGCPLGLQDINILGAYKKTVLY